MAVITLGRAARTAEKYKGSIGDGGTAARQKPDVAEVYSPPRVTAVAAKSPARMELRPNYCRQ
eukprot:11666796-Heterocapsa_arctica.AAC.1